MVAVSRRWRKAAVALAAQLATTRVLYYTIRANGLAVVNVDNARELQWTHNRERAKRFATPEAAFKWLDKSGARVRGVLEIAPEYKPGRAPTVRREPSPTEMSNIVMVRRPK